MAEKGEGGETQDVDFPFGMAAVAPLVSESLKRGVPARLLPCGWSRCWIGPIERRRRIGGGADPGLALTGRYLRPVDLPGTQFHIEPRV
jgi:hypothetical protein